MNIAIIGAGISGLTLAQMLSSHASVTVFEKARGVGGRMSTRRADGFSFDHGAQYFTARSKEFQSFLAPFMENGAVAPWQGKVVTFTPDKKTTKRIWFEPHLVAVPAMNSLCKIMAESLEVRVGVELAPLRAKEPDGWPLHDSLGNLVGKYDWVISTAPPVQTQRLFAGYLSADTQRAMGSLQACYALMLGFNDLKPPPWMAARVHDNPIKWISVNSSKPGRNLNPLCFVAHSRNNWAEAHVDDPIEMIQAILLEEFTKITSIDVTNVAYVATHRWRYSIVEEAHKAGPYIDSTLGLAASSDWSATSRIEECWQMAMELYNAIKTII